jgi:Arm DNA-binding domain
LKALKPTSVRIELSDAECKGLTFRCTPAGVKSWTFAYRPRLKDAKGKRVDKMRRITLGEYPALGLADAREAANERRKQLRAGTDPTAQRDRERAEQAKADTPFSTLCELYVEQVKERGKLSWKTDEGYLTRAI